MSPHFTPDLPTGTVSVLRDLHLEALNGGHGSAASNTLSYFATRLVEAGWSSSAIGRALGITRQAANIWVRKPAAPCAVPVVPLPPQPMPPQVRQHPEPILPTPAELDRLRELWTVAKDVNGGVKADDPRRQVSVEFSGLLAELVERGVTCYRLGKLLGVTIGGIKFRLARHGYRTPPPSLATEQYRGRATHEKSVSS